MVIRDVGMGNAVIAGRRVRFQGNDLIGHVVADLIQTRQVQFDLEWAQVDVLQLDGPRRDGQAWARGCELKQFEFLLALPQVLQQIPQQEGLGPDLPEGLIGRADITAHFTHGLQQVLGQMGGGDLPITSDGQVQMLPEVPQSIDLLDDLIQSFADLPMPTGLALAHSVGDDGGNS